MTSDKIEVETRAYFPNVLRIQANSLIDSIKETTKSIAGAPDVLERLDAHNDPEAEQKAILIRSALGDLATAQKEFDLTTRSDAPVHPTNGHSAMVLAESGLYFDPRHPISRL